MEEMEIIEIILIKATENYQYQIQSFPGITVDLLHVMYEIDDESTGRLTVFDGFIKTPDQLFMLPTTITITKYTNDAFFIPVSTFYCKCVTMHFYSYYISRKAVPRSCSLFH